MDLNETSEKNQNPVKKFFGGILGWCRRHKIITAVIAVTVIVIAVSAWRLNKVMPAVQEATYSFVRTTTLSRNGLETAVNVTGSVESADTSTVSYSAAAGSAPKIKTVNVAVGDYVNEGDTIVVLDSTDITENITRQQEALAERVQKALDSYNNAVEAYEEADEAYDDSKKDTDSAYSSYKTAKADFQSAKESISYYQTAYDSAYAAQEQAGIKYNVYTTAMAQQADAKNAVDSAVNEENSKKAAYEAAQSASDAAPDDADLAAAAEKAKSDWDAAISALTSAENAKKAADSKVNDLLNSGNAVDSAAFESFKTATAAALADLNSAKSNCNYTSYETAYNNTKAAYDSAVNTQNQLDAKAEAAKAQMEQALENYEDSQSNDTLEDLYEQLENCSLKAETSGKITSLNAIVGNTANGTIATIQNTDSLKIAVTIQEADINTVALGMRCNIRSDATEETISGTLTQIDPVSSMGGTFGAEVTVNGTAQGLLIGMNADVDIIISTVSDCFTVPADAIGEDENGSFIYRHTSGEGVDMQFEKVYVTVGESNDYYVEISGDQLKEGDVVRSYADLSIGIEEISGEDAADMQFGNMFGNMGGMPGGGSMPGGGFDGSNRPSMPEGDRSFGGGNMPGGGGMPDGGGMP